MTFTPRPYQAAVVEKAVPLIRAGKRTLIVAPTGSGKTEIAKMVISALGAKFPMAMCHTDVLFAQTLRRVPTVRVYTPQSLIAPGAAGDKRRAGLARHDLCWVDEAHHHLLSWRAPLDALHAQGTPIFGVTATPKRADGTPLGDVWDEMVVAAQYSELVDEGFLCRCKVIRSDISRNGQKKQKVRPDGVALYLEHGRVQPDDHRYHGGDVWRPGIHFELTIEQCEAAVERYRAAGVRAELVCCDTSAEERQVIFEKYPNHELDMLCSPPALAEGFDSPRAEVCVLRRMCDHLGDYLQRVGRVLRPFPGKTEALLIDCCNASQKHGLPTDNRVYSLDGDGIAAVPPPEEEKEPIERAPVGVTDIQSGWKVVADTLLSRYRDLQAMAEELDYRAGWVWHRFTEATSISPPRTFEAKYASVCLHCRKRLTVGETMFWEGPKRVFHEECWFHALDGAELQKASDLLQDAEYQEAKRWRSSKLRSRKTVQDFPDGIPF